MLYMDKGHREMDPFHTLESEFISSKSLTP